MNAYHSFFAFPLSWFPGFLIEFLNLILSREVSIGDSIISFAISRKKGDNDRSSSSPLIFHFTRESTGGQ